MRCARHRFDVVAEHTESAPVILNTARCIPTTSPKGKVVGDTAYVFASGYSDGDAIAFLDASDLCTQ